MSSRLSTACWAAWLLCVVPVASAETSLEDIQVGFDGRLKLGMWVPLEVTIEGPAEGRLRLRIPDADGVPTILECPGADVKVPAGVRQRVSTAFRLGRAVPALGLEWISTDDESHSQYVPLEEDQILSATSEVYLRIGPPIGLQPALQRARGSDGSAVVVISYENPADLPGSRLGYEMIDAMVLTTGDDTIQKRLEELTDEQFAALNNWLKSGGRLLWSVGRHAESLLRDGSRFSAWSAGSYVRQAGRWKTSNLETFAGATDAIPDAAAGYVSAPIAVLEAPESSVQVWDGQLGANRLPMIFHAPVGFGQVVLIAVDLDQPPLRDWDDRRSLLAILLTKLTLHETVAQRDRKQVLHVGFTDLTGQLRSALDQFPEISLVSFSWIVVTLMVYIAIIGPVNYFILRRMNRVSWSWFTFPVIVVLFVAVILNFGRGGNVDRPKVNQVDLVDVDLLSREIRGRSWAHLYSPVAARYDLDVDLQPAIEYESANLILSWQGLPGDGLGGFESKTAGGGQQPTYRIHPSTENPDRLMISGLPLRHASSRELTARWGAELPPSESAGSLSDLTADRVRGVLSGSLSNPTKVTLRQCVVLFRNWHYEANDLQPGERIQMENFLARRLEWQLTERTLRDQREGQKSWNQLNHDIPRIMDMLLFHGAAGGKEYTGLDHRYESHLDLSQHLHLGRAILFGRADQTATHLKLGDQSDQPELRQWTYYRFLFPVKSP